MPAAADRNTQVKVPGTAFRSELCLKIFLVHHGADHGPGVVVGKITFAHDRLIRNYPGLWTLSRRSCELCLTHSYRRPKAQRTNCLHAMASATNSGQTSLWAAGRSITVVRGCEDCDECGCEDVLSEPRRHMRNGFGIALQSITSPDGCGVGTKPGLYCHAVRHPTQDETLHCRGTMWERPQPHTGPKAGPRKAFDGLGWVDDGFRL